MLETFSLLLADVTYYVRTFTPGMDEPGSEVRESWVESQFLPPMSLETMDEQLFISLNPGLVICQAGSSKPTPAGWREHGNEPVYPNAGTEWQARRRY